MSRYLEIAKRQRTIEKAYARKAFDEGATGIHESVLRSYQILEQVKTLLHDNVPVHVILELIEIMESDPKQDMAALHSEIEAGHRKIFEYAAELYSRGYPISQSRLRELGERAGEKV